MSTAYDLPPGLLRLVAGWRIPTTAGNERSRWSWNRSICEHPIRYTVRNVYVGDVLSQLRLPGQLITHVLIIAIALETFSRLRTTGFSNRVARKCVTGTGKDNGRLFDGQVVLYGFDPFDAPGDFTRFIDGVLRINGAAQLNVAFHSFDTDLE